MNYINNNYIPIIDPQLYSFIMDRFRTLKSEIVSIISSTGRKTIPVDMLLRDYENCIGCPLPFSEFGCAQVIDLLMQMQDVLQINEERGRFMVQLYTSKSSHITALVSEQIPKRKRYRVRNFNRFRNPIKYNEVHPIPPSRPVKNQSSHVVPITNKNSYIEPTTSKSSYIEPVTRNIETKNDTKLKVIENIQTQYKEKLKNQEIHKTTDNKWILFNNRELRIPRLVLDNLALISQENPNGLDGYDIIKIYKERFRSEINIKLLGFNKVVHFLSKCSSITVVVNDKCTVFPKNWDIKSKELEDNKYFDDICGPDAEIQNLDFSKIKWTKVVISDVLSPDIFWIHTDDIVEDLKRMMFDLRKFYDQHGDKYILKHDSIKKNLICATKFDGKWHRAVVNEKKTEKIVEVSYIDYGTICVVEINDIRALHKKFLSYPKFAISSSLFGIVPVNPEIGYTPESSDFFASLIGQYFYAYVPTVNLTEPYLNLIIIDTRPEDDVLINNLMIEFGYAISISMFNKIKKENEIKEICKIGNEGRKQKSIIEFVITGNKKLCLIKYRNSLCLICEELIQLFTYEPFEKVQERLKNSANIHEITPKNDQFLYWKLFKLSQRNKYHLIELNSACNYVKMIDPTSDIILEYNFFLLIVDIQSHFISSIQNNLSM